MPLIIPARQANADLRDQAFAGVAEHFVSTVVVTTSGAWDVTKLDGLLAEEGRRCLGAVFWRTEAEVREIVSLHASPKFSGIGTQLIKKAIDCASEDSIRRLWLVTTNDNIDAIRFYQRRGFRLAHVYKESIDEARRIKPDIPLTGFYGIEIHDDLEFEILL